MVQTGLAADLHRLCAPQRPMCLRFSSLLGSTGRQSSAGRLLLLGCALERYNGSEVKSDGCSYRRPEFSSHHTYWAAHNYLYH